MTFSILSTSSLLKLPNTLKQKRNSKETNNLNVDILNSAKEDLELFYEEKVKGMIIRARARWYEHGEKSTKYFINLEKRNHIKKRMRKLKIIGLITTDPFHK